MFNTSAKEDKMRAREKELIKCPFYTDDSHLTLICEGFIENTVMLSKFAGPEQMQSHIKSFCMKEDGGKCPLALNLYDKYERYETLCKKHDKAKELYNRG